jgi:hypothetical protein
VENSLWKRLWTCRKTNYVNGDKMDCSPKANPHNQMYENRVHKGYRPVTMPRTFNRIMAFKIDTHRKIRRSSILTPVVENL